MNPGSTLLTSIALAAIPMVALSTAAVADDPSSNAVLSQMVEDFRRDLELTDEQAAAARVLAEEAGDQAEAVIDEFDRYTLESIIDLLKAERAISKQFDADLREVLTVEQRETLDKMSTDEEIERQFTIALLSEKRLEKLRRRADLREEQIPEVREIVTREMTESVNALYDVDPDSRMAQVDVLNSIDDLRDAHKRSNRELEETLDPEQWAQLEEIRRQKKPHLPKKKWRLPKKKQKGAALEDGSDTGLGASYPGVH